MTETAADLAPRPIDTGLEEVETTRAERFLAFVVVVFGGAVLALDRLRRSRSRAVAPLMGVTGAAALLGVVMAADYLDLRSAGPITLSLCGIAVTVAAIVRYQRWLAQQLPERRARKRECPWCGYPAHDGVPHCEGCGRTVTGDCSSCHQARRAGVRYCGSCGAA